MEPSSNNDPWSQFQEAEEPTKDSWSEFQEAKEPSQPEPSLMDRLKGLWGHITGKSLLSEEQQKKSEDLSQTVGKSALRSAIRYGQGATALSKLPTKVLETIPAAGKYLGRSTLEKNVEQKTEEAVQSLLKNEHLTPDQQQFVDEVATTMGELSFDPSSVGRKLLSSLGGTAAKELVKSSGGGETAQMAAKLGTMFAVGYVSPKKAEEFSRQLFQRRNALIPKGERAILPTEKLEKQLQRLDFGVVKPSEEPTRKLLEDFNKKVLRYPATKTKAFSMRPKREGASIEIDQLLKFKEKVNEVRGSLWAKPELKGIEGATKKSLDGLANDVEDIIAEYGRKNPAFFKAYKEANAMHHALRSGQKFARDMRGIQPIGYAGALTKKIGNKLITPPIKKTLQVVGGSTRKPTAEFFLKEAMKNTPIVEALEPKIEE